MSSYVKTQQYTPLLSIHPLPPFVRSISLHPLKSFTEQAGKITEESQSALFKALGDNSPTLPGQVIFTWCAFLSYTNEHVCPLIVVVPEHPTNTVPLIEQSMGVKIVVPLIVASIATPFPSVFTLIGSGWPINFAQLRPGVACAIGCNEPLSQKGKKCICCRGVR